MRFVSNEPYTFTPLNQRDKKKYGHPTCKPEHIVNNLVLNSSCEGDTVLDCFMGSGTTGAVSVRLNRGFIGIESNPTYFSTATERINNARSAWLDNLLGGVE